MRIPPYVKNITDFVFDKCSKDIGSVLIWTTIAGWAASSAAQILGIARNSKYSKEQKTFMIYQELGDAVMNIGSFFLITTPLKRLATKMVSTGKLLPHELKKVVIQNNEGHRLGKLDFNLANKGYLTAKMKKTYNSFHNFMSTTSAVVGGIISSNIVTPILRNEYASRRQAKKIMVMNSQVPGQNNTTISSLNKNKPSTFDAFRCRGMQI